MNVVDFLELGGDLGCETAGKGVWDLTDDVGGCGDGWREGVSIFCERGRG